MSEAKGLSQRGKGQGEKVEVDKVDPQAELVDQEMQDALEQVYQEPQPPSSLYDAAALVIRFLDQVHRDLELPKEGLDMHTDGPESKTKNHAD